MLFLAALLTSCSPMSSVAEDQPSIPVQALNCKASEITKIIRGTTSPNGRWAVAVGMPDGSLPQWEVVDHQDDRGRSFIINRDYDVANYLVDLNSDRIVAVLDSCHWGTVDRYNHQNLQIAWSSDSRWMAEAHHWKWHTGTCTVHRIGEDGHSLRRKDLRPAARVAFTQWASLALVEHPQWLPSHYVMTLEVEKVINDGFVECELSAEVPKQEASFSRRPCASMSWPKQRASSPLKSTPALGKLMTHDRSAAPS